MSHELNRGRPDTARRVLLRAVHTCPGAKALWLDGLHFLAEQVWQNSDLYSPTSSIASVTVHVAVDEKKMSVQLGIVTRALTSSSSAGSMSAFFGKCGRKPWYTYSFTIAF